MLKESKHTFAVLAYKESPYLADCILSLQRQSLKSAIFLSTSTPCEFLIRVSGKFQIPLVVNKESGGIASDWSFAYNNAKSKYVTLVHQDDLYLPDYTRSCLSADKDSKSLIIFTDYSELLENSRIRNRSLNLIIKKILLWSFLLTNKISSAFLKKLTLCLGSPIPCPSVTYNKEKMGDFEFSNDFVCNMDWDAWIRLIHKNGSFSYVKKNLMLHRIHKDSQTSLQIERKRRKMEDRIIFEKLWPKPIARCLSDIYSLGLVSNNQR